MLIGYARVSTREQETRLQLDAFSAAGVVLIYEDKASAVGRRPQLRRALKALKPGDTLVVWKIDRLARSLRDLLDILETLRQSGCSFRSLTEPIDTTTSMGTFVIQILGAVAQLERALIIQRTTAGIHAARARGVQWGRRHRLPLEQRIEVATLVSSGVPLIDVAEAYSVSRGCVHNYLLRYGDR